MGRGVQALGLSLEVADVEAELDLRKESLPFHLVREEHGNARESLRRIHHLATLAAAWRDRQRPHLGTQLIEPVDSETSTPPRGYCREERP